MKASRPTTRSEANRLQSQCRGSRKSRIKKAEVADEVLVHAFAAFYFIAKEEMANYESDAIH